MGVGYLISFVFRERLVGAEPALEGTLMDDVELAVVHEGDVGDDARLPKQMCPPPNADVPGGQGFAPLVDGDANKPTDPMAVLLLRVAPLARFAPAPLLARSAGAGELDALGGGCRRDRSFATPWKVLRRGLGHGRLTARGTVGRSDGVERRSLLPGGDVSPRRGAGLVPPSTDAGVPVVPRSRRAPMHHVGAVRIVGRYDTHTRRCRRSLWHVASRLVP